jgi:hypothetical protein
VKLVLTLRTRDQAAVVDALVSFHLNSGVDFVIATDHQSQDGTAEVLEAYEREGCLHLIREEGEQARGAEWRTRMARMAATDYGADWVIGADGDEFWWPRGGSLKEVLASVPERYGVVRCLTRTFVPRTDGDDFFAERMTVRLTPTAVIHDPTSPFRPTAKVAHRAHPDVLVDRGSHGVASARLRVLRSRFPIEVLHFPIRSATQLVEKHTAWHSQLVGRGVAQYSRAAGTVWPSEAERRFSTVALDEGGLSRALGRGVVAVDVRLRDALRRLRLPEAKGVRRFALPRELDEPLRLPAPTLADDAAHAVDFSQLAEADAVRLMRRLDVFSARLSSRL